ncbi:glycosyltransferase family 4 protein [Celeribacter halophilus]|uniref:glycosyltransferase family 4 protein n=1 Tax=Celeribacter halophilus TaxID=576117 RepID=UPI003A8E9647
MRVVHLNRSDTSGGAARAAWRLHQALRAEEIDSHMLVDSRTTGDWTVNVPKGHRAKTAAALRPLIAAAVMRLQKSSNPVLHSPALLRSQAPRRLKQLYPDIAHLHWINGEMMSVRDIANLQSPAVWTLHDMWAFCGAEHYSVTDRWRAGYTKCNRPPDETGLDINAWVWRRKKKLWTDPVHIIAPSQWIADCVKASALMSEWPVHVIPNAINTEIWAPFDRAQARMLLNLPQEPQLVLFGAIGGTRDKRKGPDLLEGVMTRLKGLVSQHTELVILGQRQPKDNSTISRFPMHYMGHLYDDTTLRLLYSAADVVLIPSRQDNLPNMAVEAAACGVPVVAFNTGGLPDIVQHHQTGYLAQPFDVEDMARGIAWVLENPERHADLANASVKRTQMRFAAPVVAAAHVALYKEILSER